MGSFKTINENEKINSSFSLTPKLVNPLENTSLNPISHNLLNSSVSNNQTNTNQLQTDQIITNTSSEIIEGTGSVQLEENKQLKNLEALNLKTILETESLHPKEGRKINKLGLVNTDGIPLYDSQNNIIERMVYNKRVLVVEEYSDNYCYVIGLDYGITGYVLTNAISTGMPDPQAQLYKIHGGDSGIGIAEKFYKMYSKDGNDLRYFVNVLLYVNGGFGNSTKGIYTNTKDDDWDDAKTRENYNIWIPGAAYASALKNIVRSGTLSDDLTHHVEEFMERSKIFFEDLFSALLLSVEYIPQAVAKHVSEDIQEALIGIMEGLVIGAGILALTTTLFAIIGAFVGGVGAAPGAALGFEMGLVILNYLGLAFLVVWLGSKILEIGSYLIEFLVKVAGANGDNEIVDSAARSFAEAIGAYAGFIVQGIIFMALAEGIPAAVRVLKGTSLGKKMGEVKLAKWLQDRIDKVSTNERMQAKQLKKAQATAKRLGIDMNSLVIPEGSTSGRVLKPKARKDNPQKEIKFADEIASQENKTIILTKEGNTPGVDGFYMETGELIQLKTITGKESKVFNTGIFEGYIKARDNGFKDVELRIEAKGHSMKTVSEYLKSPDKSASQKSKTMDDGTLSSVVIHCKDGVLRYDPSEIKIPDFIFPYIPNENDRKEKNK